MMPTRHQPSTAFPKFVPGPESRAADTLPLTTRTKQSDIMESLLTKTAKTMTHLFGNSRKIKMDF